MSEYININGEQYKKVLDMCPECCFPGNEIHLCPGKDYPVKNNPVNIITTNNTQDEKCLWDDMPETYPGSGIKIGGLVCRCKKCSTHYTLK